MIVVVKFEDSDNEYEIPIKKILPFLSVTEKQVEAAIQQAIRRI